MRKALVIAVLALVMLAGCSGGAPPRDRNPTTGGGSGGTSGNGNNGDGTVPLSFGAWADPADAPIRPGAQVVVTHLACTANFLFRTPDNKTLYLGVAAHCFGLDPQTAVATGTTVTVGGIRSAGKVAYNGWAHDDADENDFGLVKLSNTEAIRELVSPAVLFYGGPTGLGDTDGLGTGDLVMTYGHSVQRDDNDPRNPREGYILRKETGITAVVTEFPGVPGDSGSGLMTFDGSAVGVLSTGVLPAVSNLPVVGGVLPTVDNYVDLDKALERAGNVDPALASLELVTWPLLRTPQLPNLPLPPNLESVLPSDWASLPRQYLTDAAPTPAQT